MLHIEMDYEGSVIDFPVDQERSSIEGMILADEPDCVYWSIDIESQETLIPYSKEEKDEFGTAAEGYTEDCHLEISGLGFTISDWRDLEGERVDVAYEAEQVHPILPDNPGTFYFGGAAPCPEQQSNRVREAGGAVLRPDLDLPRRRLRG